MALDGDLVVLKKENGKTTKVPLDKLVAADQEFLRKHFQTVSEGVTGSGVAAATGLPFEQGKVVGPVEASGNASYYLYLPTTLKQRRNAPLLFYTHAEGGLPVMLDRIKEGAELCGWIMAISVQSRNGLSNSENLQSSKKSVKHILKTLPVDKKRIYFTGDSGGGAMAYVNAADMDAVGVMPNVAYVPHNVSPRSDDFFIIGGGGDYNRYPSAVARDRFGEKKAVHRMFPGAHEMAPGWLMVDGMVWFEGRYLARNKKEHIDEAKDFDASMILWLTGLKKAEPHRAYSTGRFLMDEYQIAGTAKADLQGLLDELSNDPKNVSYYEGLKELDDFSETYLAKFGEVWQRAVASQQGEKCRTEAHAKI